MTSSFIGTDESVRIGKTRQRGRLGVRILGDRRRVRMRMERNELMKSIGRCETTKSVAWQRGGR